VTITEAIEVVTKSCSRKALDVSDVARAFQVGSSIRWHRMLASEDCCISSVKGVIVRYSREDGADSCQIFVTLAQKVMSFERS
jgi:hypothetical protein